MSNNRSLLKWNSKKIITKRSSSFFNDDMNNFDDCDLDTSSSCEVEVEDWLVEVEGCGVQSCKFGDSKGSVFPSSSFETDVKTIRYFTQPHNYYCIFRLLSLYFPFFCQTNIKFKLQFKRRNGSQSFTASR